MLYARRYGSSYFSEKWIGYQELNNTCAIIDADFYNSDDGGHIWISIINDNRKGLPVTIPAGKGFCQGIFTKFYTTEEDNVSGTRNGGFGSTDGDSV